MKYAYFRIKIYHFFSPITRTIHFQVLSCITTVGHSDIRAATQEVCTLYDYFLFHKHLGPHRFDICGNTGNSVHTYCHSRYCLFANTAAQFSLRFARFFLYGFVRKIYDLLRKTVGHFSILHSQSFSGKRSRTKIPRRCRREVE